MKWIGRELTSRPQARLGAAMLLCTLAAGLGHSLALILVARVLTWLAALGPIQQVVAAAPGDDLHALVALEAIGAMGDGRISLLPDAGALIPAYLADGFWSPDTPALFGAVFPEGTSLVGLHVALLAVNCLCVFAGALLIGAGYRRLVGTAILLLGSSQLLVSWEVGSGGSMALGMVATKLLGMDGPGYQAFLAQIGLALSLGLNAVFLCLVGFTGGAAGYLFLRRPVPQLLRLRFSPAVFSLSPRVLGLAVGVALVFITPLHPAIAVDHAEQIAAEPAERPPEVATLPAPAAGPSVVTISSGPVGLEYRVNGNRRRVRCVGYNPMFKDESDAARTERYDRDFAMLRQSHVNTILGWDQAHFDDVLLASARKYSLGIIPHFELDAAINYRDPVATGRLLDTVAAWVRRYKDHPSLRMWGIGNEVIHKYAAAADPRAAAFSTFIVRAVDLIHREDPNHPVIYRDAEDVFFPPVLKALQADRVPRPWFVYGMNFYTFRLDAALRDGPAGTSGQPLLVSEFAPLGLAPWDRPTGYLRLWDIMKSYGDRVLGGCAYVWTTAGPEPVDRAMGLTDEEGVPVDASLSVLSAAYGRDEQGQSS